MKGLLSGIVVESSVDETGKSRAVIATDKGQFKFSSKTVDLTQIPKLVPVELIMEISAKLYNGACYLWIDNLQIKKNGGEG